MNTVADLLRMNGRYILSVTPLSSVKRAMKLMADHKMDALPVLEAGNLVGVLSNKDCIATMILSGNSNAEMQVRDIMTRKLAFVTPGQSVEECMNVMTEKQIRNLPVLQDGSLVGFISMSDVLNAIISEQRDYIYRLENYVLGAEYAR